MTTMKEEQTIKQEDVQAPEGWEIGDFGDWYRRLIDAGEHVRTVRISKHGVVSIGGNFVSQLDSAAHAFRVAEAMIEGRVKWVDPNDPAHMTEYQLRAEVIRLRAQMPPGFWAVHD